MYVDLSKTMTTTIQHGCEAMSERVRTVFTYLFSIVNSLFFNNLKIIMMIKMISVVATRDIGFLCPSRKESNFSMCL